MNQHCIAGASRPYILYKICAVDQSNLYGTVEIHLKLCFSNGERRNGERENKKWENKKTKIKMGEQVKSATGNETAK